MAEDIARAQGCSEVADLLSKLTSVSKLVSLGPADDVTLSRVSDAALWNQLPSYNNNNTKIYNAYM